MKVSSKAKIKAQKNGISVQLLYRRIDLGWSEERAATEPVRKERRKWLKVAEENGINQGAFNNRVYMYGWTYRKAATTPLLQRKRNPEAYRKWLKVAEENGISKSSFHDRLYTKRWSHEKAATTPPRSAKR